MAEMAVEQAFRRRDGKVVALIEEDTRETSIDVLIPGRIDPAGVHTEIAAGPAEYGWPRRRFQRNIRSDRRRREQDRQRCHACDEFVHWKSPRDAATPLPSSLRIYTTVDWYPGCSGLATITGDRTFLQALPPADASKEASGAGLLVEGKERGCGGDQYRATTGESPHRNL